MLTRDLEHIKSAPYSLSYPTPLSIQYNFYFYLFVVLSFEVLIFSFSSNFICLHSYKWQLRLNKRSKKKSYIYPRRKLFFSSLLFLRVVFILPNKHIQHRSKRNNSKHCVTGCTISYRTLNYFLLQHNSYKIFTLLK